MSVRSTARDLFNFDGWHGLSHIHVSVCNESSYPLPPMPVFKVVYKKQYAADLWRALQKRFPHFEWLLTKQQFEDRAYVDWYQHAKGMGDTQEETKLKNPTTGNVFHRVAFHKDTGLVAGIRFWCDDVSGYGTEFGWRFRIQMLDEAEVEMRVRIAEQAVRDREVMEEVEVEFNSQPLTESEEAQKVREVQL
jgi:hypothetical protein